MNLMEVLSEQAKQASNRPAIIETKSGQDRVLTFAELEAEVIQAAAIMQAAGLKKGDRVLFLQGVSTELYLALLAVFRLGTVAVFVDPSAGWKKLRQATDLASPSAVVAGFKGQFASWLMPELWSCRQRFAVSSKFCLPGFQRLDRRNHAHREIPIEPCEGDDPALLTFTSGSTGRPKAALRTHDFLLAQHRVLASSLDLQPGETDLATLPIFVLANLASGVTTVLPNADISRPGFIDPAPVWKQIRHHHPTRCAASPAFFERLCTAPATENEGTSLTKIFTGGAPVFPRTLLKMKEVFPESYPEVVYGSTEAEPISHAKLSHFSDEDFNQMRAGKGLPVGSPVPEIELAVLRDQWGKPLGKVTSDGFAELQCEPANVGEIVVTGDHVLKSYWQGYGEEETKFEVDGHRWHRTGDAGFMDVAGRLWLLGRCSAKIEDGHGIVYPFGVECAASFHPEVRRSALIGWKGQRWLLVETTPNTPFEPMLQRLREALDFASLNRIVSVPSIPVDRRHNAKIDYPALVKVVSNIASDNR